MISSAVIVPDQPSSTPPSDAPSLTLKRRQSSRSPETNKRPRLNTEISNGAESRQNSAASVSANSPPPQLPRRASSGLGLGSIEEKKRGQRLFGALLGTLSQTSTKSAHRKRDEVEKRQQERLKKDMQEKEDERRRQRAELDNVRRGEQRAWDAEGTRIRHRSMRAVAGFLSTKTEPKLYYLPWELRPHEEDRIKGQIEEAEKSTQQESGESVSSSIMPPRSNHDIDTSPRPSRPDLAQSENKTSTENTNIQEDRSPDASRTVEEQLKSSSPGKSAESNNTEMTDHDRSATETASKESPVSTHQVYEHDRGGEELVQGDEDDVIY